jgi:hypothetical protein
MNAIRLSSVFFLVIFSMFPTPEIFSHGAGHNSEEEKIAEPAAIDSMYAVKDSQVAPLLEADNELNNMFSPTDLFTQEELAEPISIDNNKIQENHTNHEVLNVQLSRHEWVSSSSKGFGTAVGITLFFCLTFAGLTFMRPGE